MTIEYWKIHDIRVVESGPLQARLWIRMGGASRQSRADLSLVLRHGAPGVEIDLRLLWAGPGARLKLEMPAGHSARYEAPGGTVDRGALGEVPGGRHACVDKTDTHGRYTLASDCLTAFNLGHGVFQCTLARSTGYARDAAYDPAAEPWRPLHDQGALRYRILLADGDDAPHRLAAGLDNPPGWLCVPRMGGARSAPLGGVRIEPAGVELLGIRPDESDGSRLSLRLLNHGPACRPQIHIGASAFTGGELATGAIGTETIPATANGA
jgi:hypothetical protein